MKRVVAAAGLLVLSGCTGGETPDTNRASPSRPASVQATTSSPSPSPSTLASSPARSDVSASTESVAGVRLGTAADEAERRLRSKLGKPSARDALPGCNGESGRVLRWDSLTVFLSDSAGGKVVLSGWQVGRGASRFRLDLPYEVDIGEPMQEVLARVPGATGSVPDEGENTMWFVARTPRTPGLFWLSQRGDADGPVDEVSYNAEGCD